MKNYKKVVEFLFVHSYLYNCRYFRKEIFKINKFYHFNNYSFGLAIYLFPKLPVYPIDHLILLGPRISIWQAILDKHLENFIK